MNLVNKSKNFFNNSRDTLTDILNKPINYASKALVAGVLVTGLSCGNGNNLVKTNNGENERTEIYQPSGVEDSFDHHIAPNNYQMETDTVVEPVITRDPIIVQEPIIIQEPIIPENSVAPAVRDDRLDVVHQDDLKRVLELYDGRNFEALTNILRDDLYTRSGHLYKLAETNTLEFIDGAPFYNVRIVGGNAITDERIGRYHDEFNRNWSTTYWGMCNQARCTPEELLTIINLSNNIPKEDILLLYDSNGFYEAGVYTGTEERHDLRRRTRLDGTHIDNYINWMRGENALVHAHLVSRLAGYDLDLARELAKPAPVDLLTPLPPVLDERIRELHDLADSLEIKADSLAIKADSLVMKADTLQRDVSYLGEALKNWQGGVLLGANLDLSLMSDVELSKAIFPEIGVYVSLGRLGIGMTHKFQNKIYVGTDETLSRVEAPADRSASVGASVRDSRTSSYIEGQATEGMIFYQFNNNKSSVFITGGVRTSRNFDEVRDHFWKEVPGPNGQTYIIGEDLDERTIDFGSKNVPVVGLGASTRIIGRLSGYGRISTELPDFNNPVVSAGLKVNLRRSYNDF
jgi:hypothetical protein